MVKNIILKKDNGLVVLELNRPEALNSLNKKMLSELKEALELLEKDESIMVVIITGTGKAFVAGADIEEMKDMTADQAWEFSQFGQDIFNKIENSRLVYIAAVNGYALGGGNELALACDIRIVSEKARFGQPEVSLGIIAGFGGTQRLTRLVGEVKARELLLTGKIIKADEAFDIGLVNKVIPANNLLNQAKEMAAEIMNNSPVAVENCKKAINAGLKESLDRGLKIESDLFAECYRAPDQLEGMEAFLEKRKAKWQSISKESR